MPTKRMLVDATHPEETRVVVTSGNRLEEFDFESATRRQLRGNIYLAKVTRVEPSLQAAFVDYGGNRHGFLAFSEIHPDYYQIPVADREALMAEYAQDSRESEAEEAKEEEAETEAVDAAQPGEDNDQDEDAVDSIGGDDALEEAGSGKRSQVRRYKIQEVIKRRQVMLVQVVKEERGNKGAALTTFLSLAGRYSVLMPNTARGGGISRKITSSADRKRLKEIANELEVPQGMGVILRTAGASRTKAEVKRDFEYLARLWENVRSVTLQSTAPSLVYEEGSLIKRTIRDLYNKDIDEVWVAGDEAYREAKDFMRMIMPSHAKNVQQYKEDQSIFTKYAVESQLDSMFSPQVTLPSGGYIVINPTEALVSIDVNSGRATKEHNIEDTALQTNLETADEVARQLRLRDLAGLIVIDFIDMMDNRSIRAVERRLKDALKNDRARIQVGRISHFGLLEMSRQRMRAGVLEGSTHVCPTCQGAGIIRSVESLSLMVMRAIEDHVVRKPGVSINVRVPMEVALYILNMKRVALSDMESKNSLSITISAETTLTGSQFHIDKSERQAHVVPPRSIPVQVDSGEMEEVEETEEEVEGEAETAETARDEEQAPKGRRRRRRRGGRDRQERAEQPSEETAASAQGEIAEGAEGEISEEPARDGELSEDEDGPRKRRRRGRRGGRRNRRTGAEEELAASEEQTSDTEAQSAIEGAGTPPVIEPQVIAAQAPRAAEVPTEAVSAEAAEEKPAKKPRRPRRKKSDIAAEEAQTAEAQPATEQLEPTASAAAETVSKTVAATPSAEPEKPKAETAKPRKALPPEGVIVTSSAPAKAEEESAEEPKPKKAGWWQRGFLAK